MEDAEIQFKEALYRGALEAAYFLRSVVTRDEPLEPLGELAMEFRMAASGQLINSALSLSSSGLSLCVLEEDVVEALTED